MNQAVLQPPTVRFERLLPGPVERVWDYLTQPDLQRTWLAESASEFGSVTRLEPHRRIEFALPDSSVVSMELEPRGSAVKLVLTHRRVSGWLAGAATVIAVALAIFSFGSPEATSRGRQELGPQITLAPLANRAQLKFPSSGSELLYGMLGGRC